MGKNVRKKVLLIICLVFMISILGCKKQGKLTNSLPSKDTNDSVVIAYYFHRTIRCVGCLEIEERAKRIIEESFAEQIEDKKLVWVSFNLDDPGGKEYEKKFNTSSSTLVLSTSGNGGNTRHCVLEKTWELIGKPDEFDVYVRNEVQKFLNQ